MNIIHKSLSVFGVALIAGAAIAQIGSSEKLFASQPCMDGWAGCESSGFYIDVAPIRDSQGRPIPSDMRIGWFDLGATPSVSPFLGLSNYGPDSPPVSASEELSDGDDTGDIGEVDRVEVAQIAQAPVEEVRGQGAYRPPMGNNNNGSLDNGRSSNNNIESNVGRSRNDSPVVRNTVVNEPVRVAPVVIEEPVVAEVEVEAPQVLPPAPPPVGCSDLIALEAPALMGRLRPEQTSCLEAAIEAGGSQTTKDKMSRVLLINADASNNRTEWARLIRRHLNLIDRSDPDLCFQYAIYLAGGGVSRAERVIRWADYALENKTRWSGTTFQSRVFDLHRLKAQAGNRLWEQTTVDLNNAADNREELIQLEARARGRAKTFALDWLDFARATGQESSQAMSLCVSVAGNRNYCRDQ
jgi:hypothetical protein